MTKPTLDQATPGDVKSLKEAAQKVAASQKGKPHLVFFYTNGPGEVKRITTTERTKIELAAASELALRNLFFTHAFDPKQVNKDSPKSNTRHDYKVAIGSKHFKCYSVDLTSFLPSDSPNYNWKQAPSVAVVGTDGEVVGVYRSSRTSQIFNAMCKAFPQAKDANDIDLGKAFKSKVNTANATLVKLYQVRILQLQKANMKQRNDAAKKQVADLAAEWDKLLKQFKEEQAAVANLK